MLSAAPSPFLQEVTNFLAGVRYVPPANGGLFAPSNNPPSPDGYASPSADAYSAPGESYSEYSGPKLVAPAGETFAPTNNPPAPTQQQAGAEYSAPKAAAEYSAPKAADYPQTAVTSYGQADTSLAFNGNWISSPVVPSKEYLVGDRDLARGQAATWCTANGGRLAEIPGPEVQQLLANMLQLRATPGKYYNYWLAIQRPFTSWEHSGQRTLGYNDWAGDYLGRSKDCAVLNGEFLHWEVADCSNQAAHRALCERDRPQKEAREKESPEGVDVTTEHCIVEGVRITLDNWLNRLERINSTAECHAACLRVTRCNFWTWNRSTQRCYMKEADGTVVRDESSLSGTTLHSKGCHQELVVAADQRKSRIEYCACSPSSDSYLNPRSLPADTVSNGSEDNPQLGRLIRYTACPFGQELVCTDDDKKPAANYEVTDVKSPLRSSNITDCIVYDMKLSGDQNVLAKLRNIEDAETCAASCISTTGCTYWTWRGDLPARTCLLLTAETEAQRRPGTASGTVRKELGCVLRIVQIKTQQEQAQLLKELRQEEEEGFEDDCTCELDPSYVIPYARSSLLEDGEEAVSEESTTTIPFPLGRIVNLEPLEAKSAEKEVAACPGGYIRVCAVEKAALWSQPILSTSAYARSEDETTGVEARIGGQDDEEDAKRSKAVRFPTD